MRRFGSRSRAHGNTGQHNQETLSDWSSYIREILIHCLNDAQPIGGPGTVVQLDEAIHAWKTKESRWSFNAW